MIKKSIWIVAVESDSWRFNNFTTRNNAVLGANSGSLSHADNCKNNFLVLRQGPNFEVNERFGSSEKKI